MKILILGVLTLGTAVFGGIVYLFSKWFMWSMIGALALFLFWVWFLRMSTPKQKTARKMYKLLYYPWAAITILFGMTKPTIGILSAYLFAFVVSMIPALLLLGIYTILWGNPSPELIMFCTIATSTILLSNHTNLIKWALKKFFVWGMWSENDAQKEFVQIEEYVLQPGIVHFIVSLIYVVFLVLYALQVIIKYEAILPIALSDAMLKAFLVYVAYSTMMKRYGEQEISTEGMAKEIWAMYKWNTKESSEDNGERVDSVVNAAPKQDINDKFVK